MTVYLLDVNALLAVGFAAHEHHDHAEKWIKSLPKNTQLATCSITELGFVRILQQVPQYLVSISDAKLLLGRLKESRKRAFQFIYDDHAASQPPPWVKTGR